MSEPNQSQVDVETYCLTDYEAKREKGIITFEVKNNIIFLVHKQMNNLLEETEPLKIPYSVTQVDKLRLKRRQSRDRMELQLIELQEQLDAFDRQEERLYSTLQRDIRDASSGAGVPSGKSTGSTTSEISLES